jgi:hypothetical protein
MHIQYEMKSYCRGQEGDLPLQKKCQILQHYGINETIIRWLKKQKKQFMWHGG